MDLHFYTKRAPHQQAILTPSSTDFAPFEGDFLSSPYKSYEALRELTPAFFWTEGQAWLISRYEDVLSVLKSKNFEITNRMSEIFDSSKSCAISNPIPNEMRFSTTMHSRNERFKQFILPFFVQEKIDLLRPKISEIVDRQIGKLPNHFDLVTEYCDRISIRVLADILAIPDKYLLVFYQFCQSLLDDRISGEVQINEKIFDNAMHIDIGLALVRQIVRQRRMENRREHLIDLIFSHKIRGDFLSDEEVFEFIVQFIVGSLENMSQLISVSIHNIASRGKLLRALRKHNELWRCAVLESFRYDYLFKLDRARFAVDDIYIGEIRIDKGDRLHLLVASALRDSQFINEPDVFDVTRHQPDLLELGYQQQDSFGKNLIVTVAEIASSRLLKSFTPWIVFAPTYNPTHRTLRAMSSLIMAVA